MIAEVEREAVLQAIAEFDRLGPDRARVVHGYGAGAYKLRRRGRVYDSKAVMGVAVGLQHDVEPPPPSTFSGGLGHAVRRLVQLGFVVERAGVPVSEADIAIPTRLSTRASADLRLYVCRPTGERAIKACRDHGFGALLSPLFSRKNKAGTRKLVDMSGYTVAPEGMPYVLDNGAWVCFEAGKPWSETPFLRLLERAESFPRPPEWAVLPDVVGAGPRSLELSESWHDAHAGLARRWLLAVQDGMTVEQVREVIERRELAGIFVGGTRSWKWRSLPRWAELGLDLGCTVHVGRVNGEEKAARCRDLAVSSIDGSSVSRFSVNAAKLARPCDGDDSPERGLEAEIRAREALLVRQLPLLDED